MEYKREKSDNYEGFMGRMKKKSNYVNSCIPAGKNKKSLVTGLGAVFLALCLFVGAVLSFCPTFMQVRADEVSEDSDAKTVRLAVFDISGFSEKDEDGKWSGIEIDLMKIVALYTGWDVELVECGSYEEALELVDSHQVDFTGGVQLEPENQKNRLYGDICAGFLYNVLAVNKEDSSIAYEDYDGMKGKKIGYASVFMGQDVMHDYLQENGLEDECELIEYPTMKELYEAFYSGEIDMLAGNMLALETDMRAVAFYGARPYFWMSYNGNEELVEELDEALMKLYQEYPGVAFELSAKFYDDFTYDPDTLTKEEKAYLSSVDTLTVGYVTDQFPYSYEEGGQFKGIARERLDAFGDDANINLKYVKVSSEKEGIEKLNDGSIDILSYYSDEDMANSDLDKARSAKRYAKSPYAIITKSSESISEIKKVAVTKNVIAKALESFDEDIEFVAYEDPEQCMTAVSDGRVDACVIDEYIFESIAGSDYKYRNLQLYSTIDVYKRIHIAVALDAPAELAGVLGKIVDSVDDANVAQYVLANVSHEGYFLGRLVVWGGFALAIIVGLIFLAVKLRRDSKRIRDLTSKDPELGIWNTSYFLYHSEYHVHHSKSSYAIVYMYLTQFRVYSNINGYEESHRLLDVVVDALQNKCLKMPNEHYGRAYGGRFVLLLEVANDNRNAFEKRLDGIRRILMDEMKRVDPSPMPVCFGVCYVDDSDKDVSKATARANMAVDSLRNSETGKTVVFDAGFEESMKNDYEKEKILDEASIKDDFLVYYQSKVDIRTNQIIGAEALVRFADPTDGGKIKSPFFFIDYYERNGRICKIDFHVLNLVCRMLRRRLDNDLPVVPISVNFSRLHFQDENFLSQLELVVDSYDLPRELIEIEVTETALVEGFNEGKAIDIMDDMINRGFRLSVDDFGTGYSSLGLLEQIPASVIKLDRSFFRNEKDHERKLAILRSFVHMSRELEVSVVCEGVEFDEDVELMQKINAFIAQGYRFSKPEPEADFERRISTQMLAM